MIIVTASSTDTDLTTTGALKEVILGATATSTSQDAYLGRLIARASRWAADYVGISLATLTVQRYRETLPGFGLRRMTLSQTPIRSVDQLLDATDTGTATPILSTEFRVEDADAGFLTRDQGWPWSATLQARAAPVLAGAIYEAPAIPLVPEPMPGEEYRPWLVDYTAGWSYAGVDPASPNYSTGGPNGTTSTGRTLPEDFETAVILRAQRWWQNRAGVAAERIGDLGVTYQSVALDSEEEVLLRPYRRYR